MATILGIDIGTSSAKAMLLDIEKGVIDTVSEGYDVSIPEPDCAEQDPRIWWDAVVNILGNLRDKHSAEFSQIKSIGFSGQMHGLVPLDSEGNPVRPAILWLDQRAEAELEEINKTLSEKQIADILHNRVFNGFALSSLLWMKNNEPDNFKKIAYVMQPKDYIRYKITGEIGTEVSDASATLLFDVRKRRWAEELVRELGIPASIFPKCLESSDIAGYVTEEAAEKTGLRKGTPAVYGAGDQQAQSIGNGAVREGLVICNIGTGGQISTYSEKDIYDSEMRTHTFCHCINKAYTIFGAILCGGMSLKWLKNNILHVDSFEEISRQAAEIEPGSGNLLFLPYLSGERTPHMNPHAKGVFFGLQLGHDSRYMSRAVMEGVTFALKDSLEIIESMGITSERVLASGGAAVSEVWLQIQADIFDKEVQVCKVKEQACLGACILGGVGAGYFKSIEDACSRFVEFEEEVYKPIRKNVETYKGNYITFKMLYENTKEFMH
ncbi:xylulokinase [Anaerobium acetethylicum]|uniref:Xylulose kinase n=1 Tax=Anaerobium acetethylicum TaxID=1619234 RepID=A0A1D3TW73_9FIRM|nr:xylulokinase [Anaerobium acetethylicum]SCP98441.1 xylulokinase [Anaerobium acetethylicum]